MRPCNRVGRAARRTLAAVKRLTWLERKPLFCVPHRDLRWFAIPKSSEADAAKGRSAA